MCRGGGLNTRFDEECVGGMFIGPAVTVDPPPSPSQRLRETLVLNSFGETSLCLLNAFVSEWAATWLGTGQQEAPRQINSMLYSMELNRSRPDIATRRSKDPRALADHLLLASHHPNNPEEPEPRPSSNDGRVASRPKRHPPDARAGVPDVLDEWMCEANEISHHTAADSITVVGRDLDKQRLRPLAAQTAWRALVGCRSHSSGGQTSDEDKTHIRWPDSP